MGHGYITFWSKFRYPLVQSEKVTFETFVTRNIDQVKCQCSLVKKTFPSQNYHNTTRIVPRSIYASAPLASEETPDET